MAPNRNTGIQSKRSTLSLAKTTSGSFGGDPSQETARAGGLRLSALQRVDGSRSPVEGNRKGERYWSVARGSGGSAADYAARRTYR